MYLAVVQDTVNAKTGVASTKVVSEFTDNEVGTIMSWHSTCSSLWNDAPTLRANVKIVDEALNQYGNYAEFINRPIVEGYLYDGKFYVDAEHETEVASPNQTFILYVDITDPENPVKYKYNGSKYVAL